ncbi:hypothetical protein Tco_1065919 [Tanacetum coccineum]
MTLTLGPQDWLMVLVSFLPSRRDHKDPMERVQVICNLKFFSSLKLVLAVLTYSSRTNWLALAVSPDGHASLPRALANIIGTMDTLELKSHTYYEHGTFESFTYWKLTTAEEVEESAGSSNVDAHVDVKIKKLKRLATHPSVATPSKPIEDRKKKRVDSEDSDDEVICAPSDGPERTTLLLTKRKKEIYCG